MNDKIVDDIEFHQQTIATDSNTPLHLIREKELEISGRMLQTKREADEIVSDARKKGVEIVNAAESVGGAGAADRETSIRDQAQRDADALHADAKTEAERIQGQVNQRTGDAVRLVLDAVTTV
jgi:vacuolar-type H+-ATPase subunit H